MHERIGVLVGLLVLVAWLPGCSGSSGSSDGGVHGSQTLEVGPGAGADYASIQEAVVVARAGSTILVQAGTFAERVEIAKSLTIRGSGPGTLVEYPAGGAADAAVIEIRGANGVRIEGLSVRGSQPDIDGIRVRDASSVVLESIVASGNSQDGIDVRRSSAVEIISGTFENNGGDGVQIDEASNGVTILSSRAASNSADGIKIGLSGFVVVEGCTSTLNGDDGFLVRSSTQVQLIGNSSTSNGGWGVSVHDSPDTLLDGNTVVGNGAGDVSCEPEPCGP